MADYFHLSDFKKFEMWLDALVVFHGNPGLSFGKDEQKEELQRNFLIDVRTSMQIVQDLLSLSDAMLRRELEHYKMADPTIAIHADQDPRLEARRIGKLQAEMADFLDFWDFLEQFRILGTSSLRLEHFSRLEFKSLGSVLTGRIERFRQSDAYGNLGVGASNADFRYLVQRDIVMSLEMPGIQEQVERIFLDFFHILQLIRYIQQEMRRQFRVRKLLVLFEYCFYAYQGFLDLLNESRDYLDRYQPEIVEAIFSTTFALKMETKKVFEERLENVAEEEQTRKAYAVMEDALGLVQNAFRECFINMVHLLNPDFDERRLFEDMWERYKQTVKLISELTELHDMAKSARDDGKDSSFNEVVATLERFEKSSKRLLFFKDWQDIEDFVQELTECDPAERPFALHRFEIFLTTLLSEVSKRTVLSKFRDQEKPPEKTAAPQPS
ncbi:MAG TPA: hypothetical protein VLV83_10730 [Acidobacteriota bacterium]|nr:hypothetical protein [Acidobacteriota bacterium]